MATYMAGSVGVLVTPNLSGFQKDLKRQLTGSGMEAVGRDIGEDISDGVRDEASEGAKDAAKQIKKNLKDPLKKQNMGIAEKFKKVGKKAATQFKDSFVRWAKRGLVVGGTAIGVAVGAAVVGGFKSAIDQQQGQLVLEGLYGDAEKAAKTLEDLKKVSSKSPLEYKSYQEGAQSLAYAGVEGEKAVGILENMGSVITAAGGDASNMDSATDSILKMVNAGKVNLESLQQLSDAGIPILSGLSEHYGVSMDEINTMASEGQIELDDVLSVMESGTGDTFQKMLAAGDAASGSFSNQWKMAKDNIQVAIGETMVPLIEQLAPLIEPATDAIVGMVEKIPGIVEKIQEGFQWIKDNQSWLKPIAMVIGGIALALGLVSGALSLVTLATTAWGIALSVTPLGWIVIAIGAVVGALVWFFTQTELGAELWDKIWGGIKTAAGAVWDWIKGTLWPGMVAAWDAIAAGAIWLYENAIKPAWEWIKQAIGAVADWVMNTLVPWLQSAWTAIGNAMSWLYNTIILPVWDAIRIAIAIAVGIVMSVVDLLVWYFNNVLAPVFLFLYHNVVLPVWNGIKAAISAVVAWFRDTAWPILSSVITWIRTKFEQFKLGLQIIWNFIKNNVINPVIAWFQNTVWPILSTVINWIRTKFEQFKLGLQIIWNFIKNNVINPVVSWFKNTVWPLLSVVIDWIKSKFDNFKNNLQIIWQFVKNNIINPVIAWFRDTAWPLISNVIESIKSGFQGMKDRIKSIWDGIQNNVINPVVNWFETKVLDRINKFVDKVKSAFQGMKDGIGEAFEKVKDKVRGPVEWLIDTVVNDSIIDNINSVLTTFGMEDKHIGTVSLPKGFATGGYTGPGSKYQPAGVVHADEFVIRKESQNSLRRAAPGFLDSLNRYGAKALHGMGYGYASGGLVTLGPAFHGSGARGDGFGARGGKHKGIDWALPSGHALIATADGTALRSSNSAAGNKLTLSHGNGIATTYHHLSGYAVASGASVKKGQVIGYVGSTGRSSGPHLHLGVQKDGNYVNPDPYLTGGGEAGSGSGGFFNPFAGLWDSLKSKVSEKVGDSVFGQMLGGMPKFIIDKGTSWFTDQLAALGDFASDAVGATRWSGVATEALVREGQFGPKRLASLLRRMGQESSYNPRAINNWDSNAAAGNSSRGLMQVIPTTFAAYRDKNLPNDIYDPLANIVASIRYTLARYGDLEKGWDRKGGYANGGLVTPELHDSGGILKPGLNLISNKTKQPEAILTSKQWDAVYQGRTGSLGDLTLNQYINDADATADRIAAGVSWELRRQKITGRR